ncbi:unnamed protein product [Tetraodon nigroviridis]|uniref:(spotted green pufferfish) hypothetical protein n=1 Tax=Tetraodon nigroviridis TaxID=99883 RepID=Q4RR43_TETNG|nr:unnamed protein product [Tetraodon nigroviridis]
MSSSSVLPESLLGCNRLQEHPEGYRSDPSAPLASQTDAFTDPYGECDSGARMTQDGWKRLMNVTRAQPDRVELMTDLLKYELSRAVNRSVDSVFKNVSLLQTSDRAGSLQALIWNSRNLSHHAGGVQTEALSLVLPKAAEQKGHSLGLQRASRDGRPPAPEPGPKRSARHHAQGRSKVSSRSLRSLLVDPPSPHLHHVKMEPDILANNYHYTLNVSSRA